jgi:hypothetical protein
MPPRSCPTGINVVQVISLLRECVTLVMFYLCLAHVMRPRFACVAQIIVYLTLRSPGNGLHGPELAGTWSTRPCVALVIAYLAYLKMHSAVCPGLACEPPGMAYLSMFGAGHVSCPNQA